MDHHSSSHRLSTARGKKSRGSILVGLFLGLVLGVLCAAAVIWYIFRTPTPFNKNAVPPPSVVSEKESPPLTLPGKPGDPVPPVTADGDKPRFDFYKILPGKADAVPEAKPGETKPADAQKSKGEPVKDPVYVQTGSFKNADDADNQKAKLALMGVESSVQQVMLQDKVWYRVRLGPFKKTEDANAVRADLAAQGIETAIVRKE